MSLFNRSKKKNNFEDINPLNISSIVRAYKSKNPAASEEDATGFIKKLAEPDEDQEHLTAEGELPWGWHTAHKEIIDRLQSEYKRLLNAWLESRKASESSQYTALKSFVIYMNDVKTLCQNKGECFVYWRDGLFDDDYLLKQTDRLKKLEGKMKKA